jgi:hypothetical protein
MKMAVKKAAESDGRGKSSLFLMILADVVVIAFSQELS